MKTGDIFIFDNSAMYENCVILHEKIICFDDFEVFCDSKRIEDDKWKLDKPKLKTGVFTRSSRETFEQFTTQIGHEVYSEERLSILRPDVPMRIGRVKGLSWGDEVLANEASISKYLEDNVDTIVHQRIINAPQIYLEGRNKNEMPQKAICIAAKNGKYFTVSELLYHANIIQNNIKSNKGFKSEGTGIYRFGIKNGFPAFYIWGYYDLAGFLKKYELKGVDIANA